MDLQYNPSAECCVVMLTLSLASIGQVIAFIMQICTESNKSKVVGETNAYLETIIMNYTTYELLILNMGIPENRVFVVLCN